MKKQPTFKPLMFLPWVFFFLLGTKSTFSMPSAMRSFGIIRVGEVAPSSESSFELLEKKLFRWLSARKMSGKLIQSVYAKGELIDELKRLKTALYSNKIFKTIKSNTILSDEEGKEIVEFTLNEINRMRLGPELQEILWFMAFYQWMNNRKALSLEYLNKARSLHPDGIILLPHYVEWDDPIFQVNSFDAQMKKVGKGHLPLCDLTVEGVPEAGKVKVNGFEFGKRRSFRVGRGRYRISVASSGVVPNEFLYRCNRLQRKTVHMTLKEKGISEPIILDLSSPKELSQSYFLIQKDQDRFKLFLYTPERTKNRLDEIKFEYPLLASNLAFDNRELPIHSDALESLFEKHEDMSRAVSANHFLEDRASISSKWYDDWKFWTALGLMLGGVIVHQVTSENETVGNQSIGMKIRVE